MGYTAIRWNQSSTEEVLLIRRTALLLALAAAALAAFAGNAFALRYHERPPWFVGVGYGIGRGTFVDPADEKSGYRSGVNPQVRFGRMVGRHFMLGANYTGWVIEFGNVPTKIRRSLQSAALAVTVFPGNPKGPTGGLYLRAGGGPGWTGTAEVEIVPGGKQEHGTRVDEWGFGAVGEVGYEFWITSYCAAGLIASYSYFGIDERIVDHAWFASGGCTFNIYF